MRVNVTVNGTARSVDVEDRTLLVHLLRENLGLTATNIGCDTTSCGACTVLVDGESVKSCTMLAAPAEGRDVVTLEGLSPDADPATPSTWHPVQQAFRQLLFSRIVPCVRDIGLWGPKVQRAYVDLGVMDAADSDLDALMRADEDIADQMEREHAAELAARKQEVDAAIASGTEA